jgi:hypothetical protein
MMQLPRGKLSFRSGSAWLGRSQKDGLPCCRGGKTGIEAAQGHRLAPEGSLIGCPFVDGNVRHPKNPACVCLHSSSPVCHRPMIVRRPAPAGFTRSSTTASA